MPYYINTIPVSVPNEMNNAYRIDFLTYGQVSNLLAERPAVILPLGGCEPFGAVGRIGVETLCAGRISDELSTRCRILSAPSLPFGCSTPFIAFPGAAGVKPRTFVNMLCEIIRAYALQGAKRIFLISAAPFNKSPATEAAKRIEAKHGGVKVLLFDINTIVGTVGTVNTVTGSVDTVSGINGNSSSNKAGKGDAAYNIDRADAALLAMASYLISIDTSAINIDTIKKNRASPDLYKTWKRRGADPQKLRKMCPSGLLLPPDDGVSSTDITAKRGQELFDRIVTFIQERIEKE